MKTVVTGAAGRLGRHVVRELADAGHEVIGVDKVSWGGSPVRMLRIDLLDAPRVLNALADAEAVVHLANHPHARGGVFDASFTENVATNFNVFDAARVAGARLMVFASSVQAMTSDRRRGDPTVRGALPWLPLDGDHPAAPTNPYALSKSLGEEMLRYLVRNTEIAAVAVRFPFLLERPPPPEGLPLKNHRIDEAFTWLTFADGARLVRAVLASPFKGLRIYLPAARRPWLAGDVEDLRKQFFLGVPVKGPAPLASFVDCRGITRDLGWTPREV